MILLFQFIIGTVLGSFISLISIRNSRNESIVFPPSHCDHCRHQLKPWELIPVISFICLKGRCSKCQQPIDPLIFIGETLGGIILISNPLSISGCLETGFNLTLLLASQCDFKRYQVSTESLITLFLISIVQLNVEHNFHLTRFLLILIIYLIASILNSRIKALGNGDVDLLFILFLKTNLFVITSIVLLASAIAIIKYLIQHQQKWIPYIPYLSTAYFVLIHLWIKK